MSDFTDSLRGYAHQIHVRDNFKCRYCGVDGKSSFDTWLTLTVDHLLPKGNPNRDNPEYMVTACSFCNTADNRYFDLAVERGITFDRKTQDELVAQRLPYVENTRNKYRSFWKDKVVHSQV
jgi:5-methylcytosine-specific restriction endonuclease McrA